MYEAMLFIINVKKKLRKRTPTTQHSPEDIFCKGPCNFSLGIRNMIKAQSTNKCVFLLSSLPTQFFEELIILAVRVVSWDVILMQNNTSLYDFSEITNWS